jgi:hypothetical protein
MATIFGCPKTSFDILRLETCVASFCVNKSSIFQFITFGVLGDEDFGLTLTIMKQ